LQEHPISGVCLNYLRCLRAGSWIQTWCEPKLVRKEDRSSPLPWAIMVNITELFGNTALAGSVKNATTKYFIRHHDRIDTFCDSGEVGTEFVHFLICGLLQSIIHVLGLLANICTLLVLRKPDSHAAVYVFLIGLVLSDSFILITNGFSFILPQLCKYIGLAPAFTTIVAPSIAPYFYPLVNIGNSKESHFRSSASFIIVKTLFFFLNLWIGYTSATYFTAFLVLERYVVVCRPFHHRRLCSLSRSYKISVGILLGSIILNIPRFFDYGAIPTTNPNGGEAYEIAPLTLMTVRNYRKYYLFVAWFMTRFIIPVSVMVYSTFGISVDVI